MEHMSDQFDEHISALEGQGVSFPAPGMARMGESMVPVVRADHLNLKRSWGLDLAVPDERNPQASHSIMVNTDNDSNITSMHFHPAGGRRTEEEDPHDSGAMRWQNEETTRQRQEASPELVGRFSRDLTTKTPEEFMSNVTDRIRNAPHVADGDSEFGSGTFASPKPADHFVEDATVGSPLAKYTKNPPPGSSERKPDQYRWSPIDRTLRPEGS